MNRKIQNIIIFFLLSVFLTPIAVKSVHRHERMFVCSAENEKLIHASIPKCDVYDYEFSLFTASSTFILESINFIADFGRNLYRTVFFSKPFFLNILLRAPPLNNQK